MLTAGRLNGLSVRMEMHLDDGALVPLIAMQLLTFGQAPKPNGLIVAAGNGPLAVARQCDA